MVRYAHSERAFLEDLENISLNSLFGPVPLREFADLEFRLGPRIMTRENSQRTLEIHGYHLGRPLSEQKCLWNTKMEISGSICVIKV